MQSTIEMIRNLVVYRQMLTARIRADERGEATEKVLITAVFAALALAAGAIIVTKVMAKANSIDTGQ
jgi:hypothetical protein